MVSVVDMYLKFIKLHVDKLAIGGELRNLTFFRDTVKNAKSPTKRVKHGVGGRQIKHII